MRTFIDSKMVIYVVASKFQFFGKDVASVIQAIGNRPRRFVFNLNFACDIAILAFKPFCFQKNCPWVGCYSTLKSVKRSNNIYIWAIMRKKCVSFGDKE